jgi:hypothetical protein
MGGRCHFGVTDPPTRSPEPTPVKAATTRPGRAARRVPGALSSFWRPAC